MADSAIVASVTNACSERVIDGDSTPQTAVTIDTSLRTFLDLQSGDADLQIHLLQLESFETFKKKCVNGISRTPSYPSDDAFPSLNKLMDKADSFHLHLYI